MAFQVLGRLPLAAIATVPPLRRSAGISLVAAAGVGVSAGAAVAVKCGLCETRAAAAGAAWLLLLRRLALNA